ncbi:MAG: AraC family transcriptional regulator [Methanosarcinaceae archaeon]
MEKDVEIRVREMPELNVAYVRHVGPYKGDMKLFAELFGKLMEWAGPRDLLNSPETMALSVYHDDPRTTEEDKSRISVCITVPEDTEIEGEVEKMTVPGGMYAVGKFELDPDEYEEAWNMIYYEWLPKSKYQFNDPPCFEIYLNDPNEHPENKHIVDICIPVKPL